MDIADVIMQDKQLLELSKKLSAAMERHRYLGMCNKSDDAEKRIEISAHYHNIDQAVYAAQQLYNIRLDQIKSEYYRTK